jgi:hypothetical protein
MEYVREVQHFFTLECATAGPSSTTPRFRANVSCRGPKKDEVERNGEDYITRSFMNCPPHQILFG